jgi:hypothetical protein
MVGSFNTLNGLATLSDLEVCTMVRKSVALAAAKSYSLDALETHFRAVEGRFESSQKKMRATHNLILAHVVKLNDADTAKEAFVKRFGITDKDAPSRLSQVKRNVAALDALGWIDLPTGNKDLTLADTDKVAGIVAAFRKGDVEQIAPAIKVALDEGLPMTDALKEGAKVGERTKGTTGKGRKGGAKPGAKTNTPETQNKAQGGTTRDNSTDAKSDDRPTFTRVSENLASAISLLKANGSALNMDEWNAIREQLTVLAELRTEAISASDALADAAEAAKADLAAA